MGEILVIQTEQGTPSGHKSAVVAMVWVLK
jgi:hypothetical protein